MNTELMNLIIKETTSKKDEKPEEIDKKENILVLMAEFIDSLSDDVLDDESYEKIEIAFDALFDVVVSLGEEDLDDASDEAFVDLMKEFDKLDTVDVSEGVYKYKPRKKRGKLRSQRSKLTGAQKMKMIKKAREKRKLYKRSASMRLKAKKKAKKYRKSAKGKQTKRIYKSLNKK